MYPSDLLVSIPAPSSDLTGVHLDCYMVARTQIPALMTVQQTLLPTELSLLPMGSSFEDDSQFRDLRSFLCLYCQGMHTGADQEHPAEGPVLHLPGPCGLKRSLLEAELLSGTRTRLFAMMLLLMLRPCRVWLCD